MTPLTATESDILAAVAASRDEHIARLQDLVRYPSLLGQEDDAQAHMARSFEALGLAVRQFEIDHEKIRQHPGYSPSLISYAGRRNVVGLHQPQGPVRGRSLILNGHIDVVPVGYEGLWTTPPFEPRVDGDRVYGRGANDMKAGIVSYTMAMALLQRLGFEPAAPVILQSVIEEECTGNGALACLVEGYTADAALIPEPTEEAVVCAQMGVLWLGLEVFGLPVHAMRAHTGVSALDFVRYMVDELRQLEREWNAPERRHAAYCHHAHPINFNLGRLNGGEWNSSVSTHARADLRIGYYPGRTAAEVKAEVEAFLAAAHARHPSAASVSYRIVYGGFQGDGLVVDMDEPAIQTLLDCHASVRNAAADTVALTATTDLKFFHLYGNIPCTCYGPRGGSAHGIDEWVSIQSMLDITAVYALFIARWCGLNPLPRTLA
jgi:acetylornithine deacetylase